MYLLVLISLLIGVVFCQPPPVEYYTVYYDGTQWSVQSGKGAGVATAKFQPYMNHTGWDIISITTNGDQPDELQAFAAGYIESTVTLESIWAAWLNFELTNSISDPGLANFVLAQDTWMRTQVKNLASTDPYWAQVQLILAQLDGLVKGYADHAPAEKQLSYVQQLFLQLQPEIGDILTHIKLKENPNFDPIKIPDNFNSHCSVLIRVTPDLKSLYAAHDTWSGFDTLLRTYKFYTLNYKLPSLLSPYIAFSSYPGNLQSTDDFYVTSQKLFVAETTNDVFNNSLYLNYISPQSVPEWVRVILANRMASSGPEWAKVYQMFNSGTYNNQFQVVDYKLFVPGQPLKPNTLWIVEQIPGQMMAADQTAVLSKGFWPSYNIPFYPNIYNISGYPAVYTLYGNEFSYSQCARALIFHRDAPNVITMDDMKRIMRYNEYQTDPLSLHDACRSIAARCDLNTPWSNNTMNGFSAFGALDAKITSNDLIQYGAAWAISGPTADSQPPFAWTKTWEQIPHYGMPYLFNFDWAILSDN